MLAMEASRQLQQVTPQLTLRFYKGQEDMLMEKAITMIGEGGVYPMLYNDEVNIPAVANAFEVSPDEAVNYVPFGCGEYTLYHRSVGTPSGVINLLQALNVTLHEGKDPKTGRMMGVNTGHLSDFKYFNDVFAAYKKQVEHFVEQLAYQEALEYKIAAETSPFLLLSILYDDCIKQGKPLLAGGVRYLGGTLETYGNTNTADSLVAIKKVVFEEQRFTLPELVEMLDNNFEGYKKERNLLLQAPKYGNDNDTADAMKVEVDRHVSLATRNMKDKTNLHSYLVVIINNNANTVMGRHTAASADGRKAWTYMANGNAPTGSCDTNGVTALLNSLVKPDATIHAGAVQNMKFSTSLFTKHRPELEALLYTYFSNGGAQAMINVLNKDDLKNAMNEPEKHSNLIVRVGGYCARFVDLPRDVQEEVLSRTLY
jgi:pyruvate-formate lyase